MWGKAALAHKFIGQSPFPHMLIFSARLQEGVIATELYLTICGPFSCD